MKSKIQIEIPEHLTISQYQTIAKASNGSKLEKLVGIVEALSNYSRAEIEKWPIGVLAQIGNDLLAVADRKGEFHTLLEFKGKMYGYAHMNNSTLGEYIDLENLCKDFETNLHKVAAIIYRPVTKHRFNDVMYTLKAGVRTVTNGVDDVFGWYDVEVYDSQTAKERHEEMKDFPIHVLLGAISFFLSTADLYLTDTLSSTGAISKEETARREKRTLDLLLQSIGDGSALYTRWPKQKYSKLQDIRLSLN